MYKNTIYANNPLNKSEKVLEISHEIDQIKFDTEGDKLALLIQECLTNKKSSNLESNILISYAFVIGYLKILENKECFLAISRIGFHLSLPLIVRHAYELWAAIYYSENCLRELINKDLKTSERESLNKKIIKLVTGTKIPEALLKTEKKYEKSIHTLDMIRALNKGKSDKANDYYDILSEFCHPNFNFNWQQIGMYSQYDFRTMEFDPTYEKTLIFLFNLEKTALLGIKESLNNISELCFEEYQIKWIEKATVQEEINQENTEKQKGSKYQKILKWFN